MLSDLEWALKVWQWKRTFMVLKDCSKELSSFGSESYGFNSISPVSF